MRHSMHRLLRGAFATVFALAAAVPATGWSAPATSPTESVEMGAMIWVAPESAYYEAGLRSRDLIVKANGKPIRNDSDFYQVFAATTNTARIEAEGIRDGKPFRVTVPAYLPADVTVGAYGWDWSRYLQYYAPDRGKPDPVLRKAYECFDRLNERANYARAQIYLTSATASGHQDPLTLTKMAWLLLDRRRNQNDNAAFEKAGQMLKQAEAALDPTLGDADTESKLYGTYMVYYQLAGNMQLAAIQGRKAISRAPHLVGNRLNYYRMLMQAKEYYDAATATSDLAALYPRSIQFQRLKKNAHQQAGTPKGVIEACNALIDMMPDDVPTRLQLLPFLDQITDNFNLLMCCDRLMEQKGAELTKEQKSEILYYQARVHYRRQDLRKAETAARQAAQLRGQGQDHLLLAEVLHDRRQWKDAVIAYQQAMRRGAVNRASGQGQNLSPSQRRNQYRDLQNRMDECVDHLWSWQIKDLPAEVKPFVEKRKEWLKEREVLKHSFVMRNRYQIRNALIVVGVLMILTGLALRMFISEY